MKIIIAGGTGFLGKALERYFHLQNHEVKILTRNPNSLNHVFWDGKNSGEWNQEVWKADVLINLAGKSVDCRYTASNKNKILKSRIGSTRILNEIVSHKDCKITTWINASSATIYQHSESQLMDEINGIIGNDFSMNVVKAWEKEFFKTQTENVRKIDARTSIVLGNKGGAFPKINTASKFGLGGKQGLGNQKISWIFIDDFCKAIDFMIKNEELYGAINVTSPYPITNAEFMDGLRKFHSTPFQLNQSKALLEIACFFIRTETELILKSRNVAPTKLQKSGFIFDYVNIMDAFNELISSKLKTKRLLASPIH